MAKLSDTSDGAVKTRGRLLEELKRELDQIAAHEEEHLYPVLRKHKDLRPLVREAIDGNKATNALLADLAQTPKGRRGVQHEGGGSAQKFPAARA